MIITTWLSAITIVALLVGLFGWSHRMVTSKLDKIEEEMHNKVSSQDVRILIADKLEPYKIEYRSLSLRLDELRSSQKELDKKMEKVLILCSKIAND